MVYFYNFNFNYGSPTGQYKYAWGTREFDLSKPLIDQLKAISGFEPEYVFNLNLTAFNPIANQNGEAVEA